MTSREALQGSATEQVEVVVASNTELTQVERDCDVDASNRNKIFVNVHNMVTNEKFPIEITDVSNVFILKIKILAKTKIDLNRQQIFYRDELLDNNMLISSLRVLKGATFQLSVVPETDFTGPNTDFTAVPYASNDNKIFVNVHNMVTNEKFPIEINFMYVSNVLALKTKISQETFISINEQQLVYKDEVLDDNMLWLTSLGVLNGGTFQLYIPTYTECSRFGKYALASAVLIFLMSLGMPILITIRIAVIPIIISMLAVIEVLVCAAYFPLCCLLCAALPKCGIWFYCMMGSFSYITEGYTEYVYILVCGVVGLIQMLISVLYATKVSALHPNLRSKIARQQLRC